MDTLINIGMYLTYLLLISTAMVILFFIVKTLVKSAKTARVSLIGVGFLLLVFFIAYSISSKNDVPELLFEKTGTAFKYSKLIGSALITTYFIVICVFLTLLYAQISKFIKK